MKLSVETCISPGVAAFDSVTHRIVADYPSQPVRLVVPVRPVERPTP